jgi:hypothetical protein
MNAEFFWKIVKKEVERQRTSFEWLYRKTGIPKGTFSSWKSRRLMPRADDALKIADALGSPSNTFSPGRSGGARRQTPGYKKF